MNIYNIPIITYHKISKQKEFGLTTIIPAKFKKQMEVLAECGYQTITFKQYHNQKEIPAKPVIISFDDTYQSVYKNAFPIMKEFNFKGVLFVISDFIGKRNEWEAYPIQRKHYHANESQISEMQKFGFEIGSHSKTHPYLPHLSREEVEIELKESKIHLESTFNTDIITCCYPYGGYNTEVANSAIRSNYKFGTGNIKYFEDINNSLCLKRRSIYSIDTISSFQKKINSTSKLGLNNISEWMIQKGAYAGIIKNKMHISRSHR